MRPSENLRSFSFVFILFFFCVMLNGCVHPIAGRDADAGISAFRTNLRDLNAALVQARSDVRAGGNVQQNDPWTMRLLGMGILLLGLSYPVGKLVWTALMNVKDRTKLSANLLPMSQKKPGDSSLAMETV